MDTVLVQNKDLFPVGIQSAVGTGLCKRVQETVTWPPSY